MAEQYLIWETSSLTGGARTNVRSTPLPFKGRVRSITIKADANAAGAATFDFNLNGTSLFASVDRPVLPAGATEVEVTGLSIPHNKNDKLSLDADALPLGGLQNVSVVVVSDNMRDDKPAPIEFLIRAMYLGALGREPNETTELPPALATLRAACFGFGFIDAVRALALDLFTSPEFTALTLTTEEFVVRLYKAYLNRDPEDADEPDPDGLAFWSDSIDDAITGGATEAAARAAAVNAFAVSTEHTNRAPIFCRSQAPAADATSIEGENPTDFVLNTLAAIQTVNASTVSLANLASANLAVPLAGKFAKLLQLQADRACRVRFYSRAAYRTADASRPVGTDPAGEHGLLAEFVFETSNLLWDCSPVPELFNLDDLSATMLAAVQNLSGGTSPVALTLKVRLV